MIDSSRLHLFLGIPIVMTLIIAASSVGVYLVAFPPYFRGWGEVTPSNTIAGWAVNEAEPLKRVEVELYIDGRFVANGIANLSRPDVVAAGRAKDEWCGYGFKIPQLASGEHVARLYAMYKVGNGTYRTLQLLGAPLHFIVDEDGKVKVPD